MLSDSVFARIDPPDFDDLVAALRAIRAAGLVKLRTLDLPAMMIAVRALGLVEDDRNVSAPAIEELLRTAITDLDDTRHGLTARALFGIHPSDRDRTPAELRRNAAAEWGASIGYFRREPEAAVIGQVADAILAAIARRHMHITHLEMARRVPTDTRLAINWLERFAAYNWIWNAVYALGADITAYRSTLLEPDRIWDQEPSEEWPEGYTQEFQAEGYGRSALFHYASFLVRVDWFVARYGGQWLLSDHQAEQDLADAVYRIQWHAEDLNQRDNSYLRTIHRDAGGELHPFLSALAQDGIGQATHNEWQEWLRGCDCIWEHDKGPTDREHFPTSRTHRGIQGTCGAHRLVRACCDYLLIVDSDWQRIADWYALDATVRPGVSGEELYRGRHESRTE